MKRFLFGGVLAVALLTPLLAKSRVIAIDPPIPKTAPVAQSPTPTEVAAYVWRECKNAGVNPIDCAWIVLHESQDGRHMRGDDGQSRGYWMISEKYHPEVSDACADNLQCSTAWAIANIKKGKIDEWTTWLYRFKWFGNENPPL